jgi:hypothetical protein
MLLVLNSELVWAVIVSRALTDSVYCVLELGGERLYCGVYCGASLRGRRRAIAGRGG